MTRIDFLVNPLKMSLIPINLLLILFFLSFDYAHSNDTIEEENLLGFYIEVGKIKSETRCGGAILKLYYLAYLEFYE